MVFIPINHLDNYARPLKCLNDQGTYRWTGSAPEWIYPIKLSKCFYIACQDVGGGRFSYGVEDVSGEKAKIYYASSSAIPRVMVFGIA